MIDHLWAQRITRCGGGVVRVPLGWSAERAPTFCAADAYGPKPTAGNRPKHTRRGDSLLKPDQMG